MPMNRIFVIFTQASSFAISFKVNVQNPRISHSDAQFSELSLISIYAAMELVEKKLDRRINPTLYKPADFRERMSRKAEFVVRVLNRPHIILVGTLNDS